MKKLLATVVAATLLVGSTLTVNAAGLKDVFDAKYYADQYKDLYDAFGYDEDALWKHFQKYGLSEGRNMSPIIDVVKYRETYGDLDKAFGDDWDAYVDHYITYGAKEHRDTGTDFDLSTYITAYADLKEAFGDDLLAAANHYLEFGQKEERTLINEEKYEEYLNPAPAAPSVPSAPSVTPAPIVQTVGTVDSALYEEAVEVFEDIVLEMRADGVVNEGNACVTMEGTTIKVDITPDDGDIDLVFTKDNAKNAYKLVLDFDFVWLEELATTVNGKNTAPYNEALLLALLSIVSDEEQTIFDRIDMDYFSPAALSDTQWTAVGDCYIMGSGMCYEDYISYVFAADANTSFYDRDASYTLTASENGSNTECVIAYNASKLTYSEGDDGKVSFTGTAEDPVYGIPHPCCTSIRIGSGCASFEEYQADILAQLNAAGDAEAFISVFEECNLGGYTYYAFEVFYETDTAKGDPDMIYVQLNANEYIEIYDVWMFTTLNEFANTACCIMEVNE